MDKKLVKEDLENYLNVESIAKKEIGYQNDKKFIYDMKIYAFTKELNRNFSMNKIKVDTNYIDYHGDICPRCGNKFKVFNRFVSNVATVSFFPILDKRSIVVYCLCKNCIKEISEITDSFDSKTEVTEAYIMNKLTYLNR